MTQPTWSIAIGSDDAGLMYKDLIVEDLRADPRVSRVVDAGVSEGDTENVSTYPDIGLAVAQQVADGEVDRGVLICGTGIGMAISANKVTGVRATTAHDSYSAERSVLSNNCQVLALGQRVIGAELARRLVREWLGYVFDPTSASQQKVAIIEAHEQRTVGSKTSTGANT